MQAVYNKSPIPELAGNPFGEALPVRLTSEQFYRALAGKRHYDPRDRKKLKHERAQLAGTLASFFVPMPHHLDLYDHIYSLMQKSYIRRNPMAIIEWKVITQKVGVLVGTYRMPAPRARLTEALTGASGLGKSTVTDRICALFPEQVEHKVYRDARVGRVQVPIVKVAAHKQSSVRDLCLQFFAELDRILGTNYQHTHGRQGIDGMVASMARLAAVHGVGIIVLDEVQELATFKSGGTRATASILLHISNIFSSAVLMVGTPESHLFQHPELHYIVRTSGIPEWRPLKRDSPEWRRFLRTLWNYQYTAKPTTLDEPMQILVYELSRGIPDIAIRLYEYAQKRAILHPNKKAGETISLELMANVANEELRREMDVIDFLDVPQVDGMRASDLPTPKRSSFRRVESIKEQGHRTEQSSRNETINESTSEDNSSADATLQTFAGDTAVTQLQNAGLIKHGLEFQGVE
jgi:AAA domain